MKLTPEEKADRRESFRRMNLAGKIDYIFSYYKLALVLILIAVIAAVSLISKAVTHKNVLVYLGIINVAVGEDLQQQLSEAFVLSEDKNPRRNEVYVYSDLYISEDPPQEYHEYSYASRMKMLAAINAKQADVVLLNRESYDLFSRSEYLLDLKELLAQNDPELLQRAEQYLQENDVILKDNVMELRLGTADKYEAEIVRMANGLEVDGLPFFASAGFPEPVYLAVIGNTPRTDNVIAYLEYLFR